jgi:beta-glucosidase
MTPAYRDPGAAIDDRVDDLVARMTVDEKVAQLGSVWITELVTGDHLDHQHVAKVLEHGIGHVTRIGAATGLRPTASAALLNAIQRTAVEQTRLGIPVMVHEEAVGGYCARDATVFPQAIGLGATWDERLVREVADTIRRQMVAVGARHALSPVLDVARDPRWGRVEETYGEDPYLVGRMGTAYVRGLQTDDLREGVIATAKHFLGYALSEGGMNCAPVHVGPRELREVYAEPFSAAIRDAGLAAVMNSYASIDGLPCAGSAAVLDGLLRKELGFDGVVVADYFAIALLVAHHNVEADSAGAAARALTAGLDLELPGRDCYGEPLKALVADGRLPMDLVDRAVRRVLRSKFQVGLFDRPYADEGGAAAQFDTPHDRGLARRAAVASMVLLKNEGSLLPLDRGTLRRVAVVGPAADDMRLLQGDYHYPAHNEILFERDSTPEALEAVIESPAGGRPEAAPDDGGRFLPTDGSGGAFQAGPHYVAHVTPLQGLRSALPDAEIVHARGCDVTGVDRSGIPEAVDLAAGADVAVVVVGGKSGLTLSSTVGEARDAVDLGLPGVQGQLVEAVAATGTPTVVVVVSGRVHTLSPVAEIVPAIVLAWLPGEEGGSALADVLLGDAEPGGRLPVSVPRHVGQVPLHHDHRAGGGKSMFYGGYTDSPSTPLWAFGHGLGYTTFEYGEPVVVSSGRTTDPVVVEVEVTNTGSRAGAEVVQLYGRDLVASVARPQQSLIGFTRVRLEPGATAAVAFEVHPSRLAFFDESMRFVTEPGSFELSVGGASDRADRKVTVELVGEVAEYRQRDIVATAVSSR